MAEGKVEQELIGNETTSLIRPRTDVKLIV